MKRGKAVVRPVVDTEEFARKGDSISGEWPIAGLERLEDLLVEREGALRWRLAGERTRRPDEGFDAYLALDFAGVFQVQCVRCLEPMRISLERRQNYRLVVSESVAQREDTAQDDIDLLVADRQMDLIELLQDEVIMALPFAPRHADCERAPEASRAKPGRRDAGDSPTSREDTEARPHPFAALARLRRADS